MFPTVTNFVFKIMTLPHSSANVERIFSIVSLLKTKQRNRLNTKTIEGLLHSKRLVNSCGDCFNFKVDGDMRRLFNSKIYEKESDYESD